MIMKQYIVHEKENTLYHQVYTYLKQKHKSNKVFIVHRLDKDTSGTIITAKNKDAEIWLQRQFKDHRVKKEYIGTAIMNRLIRACEHNYIEI